MPARDLKARIYLKPGREIPVLRGHPWIFSGAIERTDGAPDTAAIADIFDSREHWLARGVLNPASQIRVRVLTWRDEPLDDGFFARRIARALALRKRSVARATTAYRLINGEGDFLPGLIVDRYGDFLICQFLTAGSELFKQTVIARLAELPDVNGLYEKSDGKVRQEEGLAASVGVLAGTEPPEIIEIQENGYRFRVDVKRGQKTGFFLDQRENRLFLSALARDAAVLNCFCYTGAFSIYALAGGARSVVSLDSSRPALELAEQNLSLNHFAENNAELVKGDAFSYLKECRAKFDVIVLDPPSLAHRRADVDAAAGGYKFLNLHALKHLNSGGFLLTFSCSQHVSAELFQKVVFGAAADTGRRFNIVKKLGPAVDHPFSLHHPEGEYLKGLAVHVLD
jgi:23S rRNA (cytosine1962-C5)-methyltransferase